MPESSLREIFGTDGDLSSIRNMYIVETNEGPRIGIQKWDEQGNATSVLLDEGGMYSALEKGFQDKDFATQTMRDFADKRDLGMYVAKEDARAMASAKATMASDREGIRSLNSLFQTGIKEGIYTDKESREIADYTLDLMRKRRGTATGGNGGGGNGEWAGFSAEKRAYLEKSGYVWDAAEGKPVKKQPNPKARLVVPAK